MGIYQDGLKGGSVKELIALARKRKLQLVEAQEDYARVANELESRDLTFEQRAEWNKILSIK